MADEAGQHNDCQDIRDYLDELYRNILSGWQSNNPLHPDGHSFSEAKKQAGKHCLKRPPLSEDQRRKRDKPSPSRHVSRKERRLSNR